VRKQRKRRQPEDVLEGLVDDVVKYYLTSGDFNGYDWSHRVDLRQQTPAALKEVIRPLIAAERLSARFGDEMPFIKRRPDPPTDYQLRRLDDSNMHLVRLFPTVQEMKRRVRASRFPGKTYTLELARGHAQLEPRFFDPIVLEPYLNDPRYSCPISDIFGSIHPSGEGHDRESDAVYLQTFGFAYDSNWNRAVTVYLRYFFDFSPEHQQLWKARELHGDYEPHPDYFRGSMMGIWADHIEILDAILLEEKAINDLADLMRRAPLFRKEFPDGRPPNLKFLLRPTRREYGLFVHVLDKILSENINLEFFGTDVARTDMLVQTGGEIERRQKGSIRILEEWLRENFHPGQGDDPIGQLIAPIKRLRQLRQKPAHSLEPDEFDRAIFKEQLDLIISLYNSLSGLRIAFQQHPACRDYELDEFLSSGKIRTF
jgi:hypothetical protein